MLLCAFTLPPNIADAGQHKNMLEQTKMIGFRCRHQSRE
jgi:hypothetical protein